MADSQKALCHHIEALRGYARALLGNPSQADDLVRECLVRVLARRRPDRPIRDIQAHLFAIFHSVRADQFRHPAEMRAAVALEASCLALSRPGWPDAHPACRDLEDALAALPEHQRQAVLLVGLAGFGYERAAAALGVPVATVLSRLAGGRESLRRLMAPADPGPWFGIERARRPSRERDAVAVAVPPARSR